MQLKFSISLIAATTLVSMSQIKPVQAQSQTQDACLEQALEQYAQCFDGIGEAMINGGLKGAALGSVEGGIGAFPGAALGAGIPAVGRTLICTGEYMYNRHECAKLPNDNSNGASNQSYDPYSYDNSNGASNQSYDPYSYDNSNGVPNQSYDPYSYDDSNGVPNQSYDPYFY